MRQVSPNSCSAILCLVVFISRAACPIIYPYSLTYNIINIKVGFVLVASMSIFKVQPQCYCLLYIYIARLVVFFFFFQLYYNLPKLYNKGYFELDGNSSPLCHMKRGRFLAFGNYHGWLAQLCQELGNGKLELMIGHKINSSGAKFSESLGPQCS